jgi:hypothetical protein
VLVIRDAQMDALRDSREAECMAGLELCLRESFPRDVARLSSEELHAVIRLGMERSRSHGGVTAQDMYLYLTLMFMLGSYFDEDPQLAWAQELLTRGGSMEALHAQTLRYLNDVAGRENEHLIKALARIRKLDLRVLPDASAADFEPRMMASLRATYPTKFDAQSEAANQELVQLGRSLAGRHSMPGAGAALMGGMAFLLGASFDRDPLHPWIRTALHGPGGEPKVQELYRRALEFVEMALT